MKVFLAGAVAAQLGRLVVGYARACIERDARLRETQAMMAGTAAGMRALLGRPVRVEAPQSPGN